MKKSKNRQKIKANYKTIANDKTNKIRMVEIGTYESLRYSAHIEIMKIIAIASVIILVLSVLLNRNLLPGSIVTGLIVITLAVGLILLVKKLYDLSRRSNLVYDQYAYSPNQSQLQPGYETVLQHDERFFRKLGTEVESGASSAETVASSAISGASSSLNNLVDSSSSTPAPNKQTLVSPSQPNNAESFAAFN